MDSEPPSPEQYPEGQDFVAGANEYAQLAAEQPREEVLGLSQGDQGSAVQADLLSTPLTGGVASDGGLEAGALKNGANPTNSGFTQEERPQNPVGEELDGDLLEQPAKDVAPESLQDSVASQGWITNGALAKELEVANQTTQRVASKFLEANPSLAIDRKHSSGHSYVHFSPTLAAAIRSELSQHEEAPEGWITNRGLAKIIGSSQRTVEETAAKLIQQHPEWAKIMRGVNGRPTLHYSPELTELIKEERAQYAKAPEGWLTTAAAAKELGRYSGTLRTAIEDIAKEHPEWVKNYKSSIGSVREHFHPEMISLLRDRLGGVEVAPEGWASKKGLANNLRVGAPSIKRVAEEYREAHPEWYAQFRPKSGTPTPTEYYHPDLVQLVTDEVLGRRAEKSTDKKQGIEVVTEDLRGYLSKIKDDTTLDAQDFRRLAQLFGGESAADLLYQHHPEYRGIPMPQVRSLLADYLGDFLPMRGQLNLGDLEVGADYLSNPNLKEGLTTVVKNDCLRFFNQVKRNNPAEDDSAIIPAYIAHLRQQTEGFTNADLAEVLDEVEAYYRSVFEVQKPDALVDGLREGRQFPDINQRINIKEIETKQKMLIADEMGIGKSASAILAKEGLGVKQALIVAPSNVVEVWQGYLSDRPGEGGSTGGYFKEGQAPRVLTIEDLKALDGIDPAAYDYVILSQERLTEKYVQALERFDYDMLIVDEVHKLKNIATGKRADNLLKLSEKIPAGEEGKYLALLSGTPVPNKVGDVAMELRLLYPEKFEDVSNRELTSQIIRGDVLDLRSLLVPRMQMKSLGESVEMPPLHEESRALKLSDRERDVYEVLLEEDELTAAQKLQILRQSLLNPGLLEVTPDMGSTKVEEVGEHLRGVFTKKDKVVLFVNGYVEGVIRGEHTIFEGLGLPEEVEISTVEGTVPKDRRLAIQHDLQHSNKKMLVAVSGQTADVGVDFSGADRVDFYNEPWSVYDKRQQLSRGYRVGLQHELDSTTFYTEGTIEEGIHDYIQTKYRAVEKLLRGVPLSELEQGLLEHDEKQVDPNLEVNSELAEYYFSSWDRMMKIYGHVKEMGEQNFVGFLSRYGREYADAYTDLGSRSHQANASRLSGSLIDSFAKERGQEPKEVRILDVASGPEMLRRHIPEAYADQVVSVDINRHHFGQEGGKRVVGSFLQLPIQDKSLDYANLSLALHYTSFVPSKGNYERLETLKELNRVLDDGGRAVISLMYTLDLKDEAAFGVTAEKLGFKVVEEYSGDAKSGDNFRTKVVTLEKVEDCSQDTKQLVKDIGKDGLNGLKFSKVSSTVRDSRKIVTAVDLGGEEIAIVFNETDAKVLEEERELVEQMEGLKSEHGTIENIPREAIQTRGLSRFFNGRRYILFKRLENGPGAVVVR